MPIPKTVKKVKVADIVAAAKRSSVPHAYNTWGDSTQACILGRAVLELKTDRNALTKALNSLVPKPGSYASDREWQVYENNLIADNIMNYNDYEGQRPELRHSLPEIITYMRKKLAPYMDKEVELPIYDEGFLG